jgi:hypothetical protein
MSLLNLVPPEAKSEVERKLRLMKAAPDLVEQLVLVLDELHDVIDVEDGSDGPRPNWAMRLDTDIRETLRRAGVRL